MNVKLITGMIVGGVAAVTVPHVAMAWELDQWGNDLLEVRTYHQAGITGKGVKVAVLDTGISNHRELNVVKHVNFVEGETISDLNGHGTSVAGVIASKDDKYGVVGIAPDVELYSVKVLDKNGTTPNLSRVAEGVRWAIENDMDIINISIGGTAEPSQDVLKAFEEAEQAGILVVAGTGNHEEVANLQGKVSYPAKISTVIGVGAVHENLSHWSKSATGNGIDLVAPGVNIKTTHLNNNYYNATGTSHATPHVTGVLALLKQAHPEKTAPELRSMLIQHTLDLGKAGYDTTYGYGLLQLPPLPTVEEPPVEQPNEPEESGLIYYDSHMNQIHWDSVNGATRYRIEIFQKNHEGVFEPYDYARTVQDPHFNLDSLERGYEYQFIVTPRIDWVFDTTKSLEITVHVEGEKSTEPIEEETEGIVQNVEVSLDGTTASIHWDKVESVSRYRLQLYVKKDGEFVKESYARTTDDTSYTFNNLDEELEYQLAVIPRTRFYDESKQGVSKSFIIRAAEEEEVERENSTVKNVQVSLDGTTASVRWDGMDDVSRYRVQLYVNEDGTFVKEGFARTTSNTTYTFENLGEGKEYQFAIIPQMKFYDESKQGISESVKVSVSEEPGPIEDEKEFYAEIQLEGTTVNLQWSGLEDINYYRVQRYIKNESGEFVKDSFARSVQGVEYKDSRIQADAEYKYQITPKNGNIYDYDLAIMTDSIAIR